MPKTHNMKAPLENRHWSCSPIRGLTLSLGIMMALNSCSSIEIPADQRTPKRMSFATSVVAPTRVTVIGRSGRVLNPLDDLCTFDHAKAKQIFLDGKLVGEFPMPDRFDKNGNLVKLAQNLHLGQVPIDGRTQQLVGFDATQLQNGQILLTGGQIQNSSGPPLCSTWLFDKKTNSYERGPDMRAARAYHQNTLLKDGRVLISGGNFPWEVCAVPELEIYDPKSNKIQVVGKLSKPREFHQAVELPNHRVAIIGGRTTKELHDAGDNLTSTIEVLDVDKQMVNVVGQLHNARQGFFVFPLEGGKVLIAGGMMDGYFDDPANSSVLQVEIFPGEK